MQHDATHNPDTIVAPATPPGISAIAVVRLTGRAAVSIANKIFKGKDLSKSASHTLHFGTIESNGQVLDEVVVGIFLSPHSYTGENVVEISTHGSLYVVQKLIELLISNGARMAEPGEFTLRAFMNGKLNLGQAEAVADLIAAENASQHRVAINQMRGGYSQALQQLRKELVDLTALVELELDFSEEDVEFANRDQLLDNLATTVKYIQQLANSFNSGNVLKKGVPIAIIGPPNVGKSTLLNALLKEEKAIVTELPGTTRDTIEDVMTLDGISYRFIDTAGIRQTDDVIENMGISRARKALSAAAIILLVYTDETPAEEIIRLGQLADKQKQTELLVKNKCDLQNLQQEQKENEFFISAKTGQGLPRLLEAISKISTGMLDLSAETVCNVRHYEALIRAEEALTRTLSGIKANLSGELLAIDLHDALHQVGLITGEVLPDDILGSVFSRFCIGK